MRISTVVDVEFGELGPGNLSGLLPPGFCNRLLRDSVERLGFPQRCVEGEDVVFGLVAGIVANGPVGDDEVGEGFAGGTSCT